MERGDIFDAARTGIGDPNSRRRDYELGPQPLAGLLDRPWYPPYVLDTPHAHNCIEIGVCLYGTGHIGVGGRSWTFREGSVAVVPRGVDHVQNNEGTPMNHWQYVLVNEAAFLEETPPRLRDEAREALAGMPGGLFVDSGPAADDIRAIIAHMFRRYAICSSLADMTLDGLTRVLMARVLALRGDLGEDIPASAETRRAIEPALQYVSHNYAQEVRVEDLAARCAMSESYFRKVFAAIMGMPPLEYLNRYRINRSVHLLDTTDETVLTIAGMTGFPSIATYNRNFRRYVGQSPAQWRKNAHGR